MADLTGFRRGCDLFKLQDDADDIVRPPAGDPVRVDAKLSLEHADVYSSFLGPAERADRTVEKHPVELRRILVECRRLRLISGKEDMIDQHRT